MSDVVIFIQARLTSTRLPGKVLLPFGNETVIQRIYNNCKQIAPTLVLIPTSSENHKLAHYLSQNAISYFRGPEDDVLKRFAMAYSFCGNQAKHIVRITGDCPLLPPSVIKEALSRISKVSSHYYASNTVIRTYPKGFDVEVFTPDVLLEADRLAILPYDREHVTPMIRKLAWQVEHIRQPVDQSFINLCLDTPEDYERLKSYGNA